MRKNQNTMKLGRTIVAEREKTLSESERMLARKKAKSKKTFMTMISVLILSAVVILLVVTIYNVIVKNRDVAAPVEQDKYMPTVRIEDGGGTSYVTEKMKEYVGRVERDFQSYGRKVVRAVIPAGKTREIDIYLDGRDEYYKLSIDRGSAVSAEDAVRMIKYLDERDIHPEYVDVRVEGKAYYK
ncbi:hypothetical protein IJH97_02590 [Candidatus Saccharibacteria bacterium]|nr:hypothetical protein [Candidatus Saccharibacteria bacterium]